MQQVQSMANQQQQQVPPQVITTKDCMYLKDELSWELLAMKKCSELAKQCTDPEIRQAIDKVGHVHQQHYMRILNHLQTNNELAMQQATGSQTQTIQNPTPANQQPPKTPEMNDRDRLNDVLTMEKYLTDSFNAAVREASHPALHQDQLAILNETHQCQYELFELMFRKGFYKMEAEQQPKLDQAFQQFSEYKSQFPYATQTPTSLQ
jgi:spore coat protein CotF